MKQMGQDGTLLATSVAEHGAPMMVALDYTRYLPNDPWGTRKLEACAIEHQRLSVSIGDSRHS